ncbi:hypothetical protein ACH4UX_29305 [Streptomyces althioticus]|nr:MULTISPECIES: hypothetical protein [Actinomycetes]WTC26959.1 hypothetical protein OG872_31585 [Streptomyces althioticus]
MASSRWPSWSTSPSTGTDGSDWKIGRDQMLEELGASRVRLLN